ncbi:hypothetical protein [Blastococcus sp. PRF04-17]|uniref:hypothetical protein n=1 Tax=Blastococcus sp. PRF04-17 TaxID=2933797 RepID=UPI001FF67D54|nr:hypothetical protein [Blastococcus sp. PRF04-17]UOY03194.1 hypothetical protein MVA48_07575 [Blastococcus sp. PRF04-17]
MTAQGGELVPLMNMFDGPSQQIIANTRVEQTNGDDISAFEDGGWAFTRVGSISEITLKSAAEDAGLTWEELERIPLGSGSETQAVLESDRADILSTSPNNAAKAVSSGEAYLVTNPQDDESSPIAKQLNSVLAASPDFVTQYPEFTQDVVTAVVGELSELAAATSPDEVLEGMPAEFVAANADNWDLLWEYSHTGFTRATGGFSQEEIDQTVAGAQLVAVVDSSYAPPAELFDNSRIVAAYEEIGADAPAGLS